MTAAASTSFRLPIAEPDLAPAPERSAAGASAFTKVFVEGLAAVPCELELAVVIPTFNELENVEELLRRLVSALQGIQWEAVFVDDDSPDGTSARLHRLSALHPQVRCLRRIGRRGLASATVEGMLSSGARCLAVIDADLQHDELLLPSMLAVLRDEPDVDVVVGSRYVAGGGVGDWPGSRQRLSQWATRAGRRLLKLQLADPMSGFFVIRREAFEATVYRLSSIGFKVLLDLLASSPRPLRVREMPYQFRNRLHGQSKLDSRAAWDYGMLLADKAIGRWVPPRLVSFAFIGGFGVGVHLAILSLLLEVGGVSFTAAQLGAVMAAMVGNFFLNNALTYHDRQVRGLALLPALAKFMAACGIGAAANVGVASALYSGQGGWLLSSLAGILVGTVWNYGATAYLVWLSPRR